MLGGVGQTQDTSQNLLHLNLTCLVGNRRKNIGKGAVPSLAQCVDRDNIANRAVCGHEFGVFQLIHVRCADGDLLCGYVIGNQFFADFLKGSGFFLAFRLCLKQHNGANILLAHGIFGCGEFFQLVSQVDCVQNDLCLTVAVVDDDGQLYHVFGL